MSVTWPSLADFLTSPGFGGVMAVAAAVIAYLAARSAASTSRRNADNDRRQRETSDRKQQWWQRAQWALDLTVQDDPVVRTVGFEVLDALAQSEWADAHEGDVIAAATASALPGAPSTDSTSSRSTPRGLRRTLDRIRGRTH